MTQHQCVVMAPISTTLSAAIEGVERCPRGSQGTGCCGSLGLSTGRDHPVPGTPWSRAALYGAFFVSEMRLHDRGEAIELASQFREALRWSGLPVKGQGPDLMQDRGYRGVIAGQVPDRRGQVWPGIEQLCEHAVVFAPVTRCQG